MRALVTGAAGFVGTYLLRELGASGAEVFAGTLEGASIAESDAIWLPLDVTSSASIDAAVAESRPDVVYHLAAQSSVGASFDDVLGTWETNATGTLRLLSALPAGVRVVFISSAEVYGAVPEAEQPLREDRPLRPASPYAASKAAAEMAVMQAAAAGRVDAVIARSFNHTGPGQDLRFALPSFAAQLAELATLPREDRVLAVGNLDARRDYLDVRDVVRAYRILGEQGTSREVYNVCSGDAPSLRALVDEMVELSGTGAALRIDQTRVRPLDVPVLRGDSAKLRALGWQPEIPLRRTLRDLLAASDAPQAAGGA